MENVVVDCSTKETVAVSFSAEEEAQLARDQAEALEVAEADALIESRRDLVLAKVDQRIEQAEDAHTKWNSLTQAQKNAALREVVLAVAKLGRLALSRFDLDEG